MNMQFTQIMGYSRKYLDYVFICSKTTANKQISKRLNENKMF